MCEPTVSVIIPAYRAAETIARALDSVLAQTHPAHEVIVVDDGSPDHLAEVVSRYAVPVRLIRQANANAAAARNAGIEQATGQWLAFLDADDFWDPHKLQTQLEALSRHPELDVVASHFQTQVPGEPARGAVLSQRNRERWYDRVVCVSGTPAFQLGAMLWTGTVLVRRSALGKLRFQSGLEPAEDRDLWIRLVNHRPVMLLSQPLATAVLEPGSLSRVDIARDCRNMLAVIERNRATLSPPARLLWRSFICYRWAAGESKPWFALGLLLKSLAIWPAPYFFGIPRMELLGRLRRLRVVLGKCIFGIRQPSA